MLYTEGLKVIEELFIGGRLVSRGDVRALLTDELALRVVLEGETRGEPILGQLAVGCVIRNRVRSGRFGPNYRAVCLARAQFSCLWGDGENVSHTYETAARLLDHAPDLNPQLAWVTEGIVSEFLHDDPTHGATHYLEGGLYRTNPPGWAIAATGQITINRHVFMKAA